MALGKVETINPENSQYGTVTEAESGDSFPYNDPNFKSTGLQVGSECTFDIDFNAKDPVATNLQPYTATEKIITEPFSGDITSQAGETIRIKKGGMVRGNVTMSSNSTLFIEDDGVVEGTVTVNDGSNAIVRKGGMVRGNVTINNGAVLKVVNKGTVKGNITYNSGNRLIIGNNNGPGTITGSITTDRLRKLQITADSTINCGA